MSDWKDCWRRGFVPLLSAQALQALAAALRADDPRLIQDATTLPFPRDDLLDLPVEAACAVGYCGWQGDGLETVEEVSDYFGCMCREADLRLGGPAACRAFLSAFDEWPRDEMRRLLLPEVELALAERMASCGT